MAVGLQQGPDTYISALSHRVAGTTGLKFFAATPTRLYRGSRVVATHFRRQHGGSPAPAAQATGAGLSACSPRPQQHSTQQQAFAARRCDTVHQARSGLWATASIPAALREPPGLTPRGLPARQGRSAGRHTGTIDLEPGRAGARLPLTALRCFQVTVVPSG